jgi:membrane-associated phospholipid phosphatase
MKKGILLYYFLLLTFFCHSQNADIKLLKQINVHRNQNLDKAFKMITNSNNYINFGSGGVVALVGVLQKNKTWKRQTIQLFSAQLVAIVLTQSLKHSIKRERPFLQYSFLQPYENADGYAFPSGHTSSVFANAATLSYLYKKWYVVVPAYVYATLVGYSRMHLGVHYPSDVLAGAAVGIGSAYLSKWVYKKLFLKGIVK